MATGAAAAPSTPEQRHAATVARAAAAADDREAQAALLLEVSSQLLAAERLIAQQAQSVRIAQRGRDTTKADMVATNSKLLKVPPTPPQQPVAARTRQVGGHGAGAGWPSRLARYAWG